MSNPVWLCPISAFLQVLTDVGIPLSGCLIWTYTAGTSAPQTTYTDATGAVANSNPIQLNSAGRLNNVNIWQPQGQLIKVIFSTNAGTTGSPVFGTQIGPTFDQVGGINDPAVVLSNLANPALTGASGAFGANLVANALVSYDVVTSVRSAFPPTLASGQTMILCLEGGVTVGDGLGGLFYWSASSTATDDGLTVIEPAAAGTGRWLRLYGSVSGTFTGTLTGCTSSPGETFHYTLTNNTVTISCPGGLSGTSNSTAMTVTGLPAILTPSNTISVPSSALQNNSVSGLIGSCSVSGTTLSFALGLVSGSTLQSLAASWTSSGTKGVGAGWSMTYPLN